MHFHRFLGIQLVEEHEDGVTVELPISENFENSYGQVHGGVVATLIDASFGVAIQQRFGEERPTATVDMTVSYLRPVANGVLQARSRFIKAGRTLVRGAVDVYDDEGRQLAAGLVTFMLL